MHNLFHHIMAIIHSCSPIKAATLIFCFILTFGQEQTEVQETTDQLCANDTEGSCEATMDPTSSTFVETTKVSITTRKPKPTNKEVTKKPSTIKSTLPLENPHEDCSCDMIMGECEMNCCCDFDCSGENRAVFTGCGSKPLTADLGHCFSSQLLYANNTDLKAVHTEEPGVLCVAHSNTLTSTDFEDVPVLKNVEAFEKRLGRRKYYSWPNPLPSRDQFDSERFYDKGSPIWVVVRNTTIAQFVLPSSIGHSSYCRSTIAPKYLEEFSSSCTHSFSSKKDCLTDYEESFSVVSSPRSFNFTQPQECTEDVCLPLQVFLCNESCVRGKLPPRMFNDSTNVCQNVVNSVEFKIYHNGSQGVSEVKGIYKLTNVSVGGNKLFRKHFKVRYVWAGSSEQQYLVRSGRPGYITGKPLISGKHVFKTITFSPRPETWLSVSLAASQGRCSGRQNVLFGENIFTRCFLSVNGSCSQIQQQIWAQLLGPAANLSEVSISSYGDPRPKDRSAWVPLLFPEPPPLPTLTTGINLVILHTLVGLLGSPSEKIIGAYLEPLPSTVVCNVKKMTVALDTSVRFVDKTVPAVTKFAHPPVYEIKLPQDFFYPFFTSGMPNGRPFGIGFVGILLLALIHF